MNPQAAGSGKRRRPASADRAMGVLKDAEGADFTARELGVDGVWSAIDGRLAGHAAPLAPAARHRLTPPGPCAASRRMRKPAPSPVDTPGEPRLADGRASMFRRMRSARFVATLAAQSPFPVA
ncbi:MAG: hypothetical protein HZC37_18090 [Burkholderiales bacterium]|nr:hypothetical protein [Burkholderiales bacterium]